MGYKKNKANQVELDKALKTMKPYLDALEQNNQKKARRELMKLNDRLSDEYKIKITFKKAEELGLIPKTSKSQKVTPVKKAREVY